MDCPGIPQEHRAGLAAEPHALIGVEEGQLLRLQLVVVRRGGLLSLAQRAGRLEEGRVPLVAPVLHQQRPCGVRAHIHHVH